MKYCLSSRQKIKYLNKADEIAVDAKDYRMITDLFVDYPDKMIILDVPNEKMNDENFTEVIKQYNTISKNFCCRIYNMQYANWFIENKIKYYYGYTINNFYDLQGLIDLEVEYVKITAPLTFNVNILKNYDVKFRVVPNVAYDAYIPRKNGICGQWIRPEDTRWYEEAIYVFEFEDAELEKERALYDIYAEKQSWDGNLFLLLTNLNVHADNRILPDDIGEFRSNCGQKCMMNSNCHYCLTAFNFEKNIRKYYEEMQNKELPNAPKD